MLVELFKLIILTIKIMFITLTIDTSQKKKQKVRMNKSSVNPAFGWRKPVNGKKRGLWQRIKSWRKKIRDGVYKLDGQTAMF